jgi:four helix bundle protein
MSHPNPVRDRTKKFALRVMKLVEQIPRNRAGNVIAYQLMKSASSVGANYRSAQRGRSKAEFQAKLGTVEEESDESAYWLELLIESGMFNPKVLEPLLRESNEITAMIVASINTSRETGDHR